MYMLRYSFLIFLFLSLVSVASARPKVGLVLGGGGAAGVAHVGVLKVLEENNIPVDVITGNSMGAIVGGLYASGMSAAELEKTVNSLDWDELLSDRQARNKQTFYQKRLGSDFFSNTGLGIQDGNLKFSSGLITGQKLMFKLRHLFAPVAHISNFDQLPIPFRAVATDIETGDSVVLKSGNLAQSIRASMAIPGIFSPVKVGSKLLVDGFVSNNIPVALAREMGADILIVVNIPTFLEKQDELDSAVSVALQAMNLMMLKTTTPQLARMLPVDILIEPNTKDIGSLDFERVKETIPMGEAAALAQLQHLKTLVVPGLQITQQQKMKNPASLLSDRRIAHIVINNDSVLQDTLLMQRLGLKAGDSFDSVRLQQGLENIHGLDYFDLVDHQLTKNENDEWVLEVNARKKTSGDRQLRFGLSLADDFEGDTRYQFGVQHTRQGINDQGAEWSNSLIVGDTIRFDSALYQPVPEKDMFVDAQLWHERRDFFFYEGGNRLAEGRGKSTGAELNIGRELGNWGEGRAGLFYRSVEPDIKTGGTTSLTGDQFTAAGIQFQYNIDTTDDALLTTQGNWLSLKYEHGFEELGADEDFDRLQVSGRKVLSKDDHLLWINGEIGTTFSDNTLISERLSLGGLGRLSGLAENQLVGNHLLSGSLVYLYELSGNSNLAKFYVGGSLEAGNVWELRKDISQDDLLLSASVFIGAATPLGPAFVGVAQTEGYDIQPFLYFGKGF